jgi:hypothetical protein
MVELNVVERTGLIKKVRTKGTSANLGIPTGCVIIPCSGKVRKRRRYRGRYFLLPKWKGKKVWILTRYIGGRNGDN